jgi:hypothetical protein
VSQDIEDTRAPRCRDARSPAGDHCRHRGEAPGQRGSPQLRGRPVPGLRAAGPVPGRGRRGVRAAVPAPPDEPGGDPGRHRRPDHQAPQGTSRPGPGRGPAHDRLAPAAPPPGPGLRGGDQPVPVPGRAGHPEPRKRPRSSCIRFAAGQPNECRQSGFTHYPLADGAGTEILAWLDDHSRRALRRTAHHRVTGQIVLAEFRVAVAAYGAPASALTDNGMVFTTRLPGGQGGRNGLETELRRLGITRRAPPRAHPRPDQGLPAHRQTTPPTKAETLNPARVQGVLDVPRHHKSGAGGIRTHTGRILSPVPLPLGYGPGPGWPISAGSSARALRRGRQTPRSWRSRATCPVALTP